MAYTKAVQIWTWRRTKKISWRETKAVVEVQKKRKFINAMNERKIKMSINFVRNNRHVLRKT